MMTENTGVRECPGANVIVSSKQFGVPPCSGMRNLLAQGEPVAVVSVAHSSGASFDAYDAIEEAARDAGRETLLVRPKVRVSDASRSDWRSTVHTRNVEELLDGGPLKRVCETGIVAVCGADSVYCVDSRGTALAHVSPESLLEAVNNAVGDAMNVCSPSCAHFEACAS